ncbi:hypothetical protein J0H58_13450 [bacterium]|nr:hypothetical protein [bacterium]
MYGLIEEIRRPSPGSLVVRLVCRPPEHPSQKSSQSESEGEQKSVYIVGVGNETVVRQRAGGAGELAEGQVVSVWWTGEIEATYPAQVSAVRVVVEQEP